MALVTKNDVAQIFAIQAPEVDLPPTFANYPRGWDTARSNNGKPTIKQFNYIQQRTDQNILWIHQNGAALPYDAAMEYAENAHVVKDGELQKKQGASWISVANKGYSLDYFVPGKSYPLHAEIMLANGDTVKSTVANNIINPNVDMTGWKKPTVDAYTKSESDELLLHKANSVDVYQKTETYTKSEVTDLITPKADISYVDSAIGAISTDASKQYATLALANADIANIALNENIFVSEAANGGYWYKATEDATTLTKSPYDPLVQANVYTNTAIKSKPLGVLDLNTIFTEGVYYQQTAANATALRNYPDHAQNTNSSMRVVAMTANTIMQIVEAVGKISTRMIFSASTTPTFQAWSTSLNKADKTLIDASIETVNVARKEFAIWSVSGSNGKVFYDKATKTLTWNNALVAAFANVSKRIQIAAGSIAFTNAYDTLFLDLSNVPLNGTVTTDDFAACLKVAKYSDLIATAFIQKNNQLALAQLNSQGELIAAVGFPSLATAPKDTFAYTKALDRITFYQPATNGNLIKYLLRHDVYPFDGTSSRSQTDIWRMERAIEVNAALAELQEIVTYGEWEFAMREKEYPADHVGGVHGDELLTSAYFLVDGVYRDPLTWTGTGEAKEIRLQMQSVIYRLNTQTAIADHYKELVITKNGITANQWVENRLLLNPDRFWLAMLPVNRIAANSVQVSTKDIRNGVVRDVSNAGFAQVYTPLESGSYVNVSGEKYSTSVEISNLQGVLETADVYVANDAAYNKIYVSAIGGASSGVTLPTGTKISWTTKYKVDAI